MQVLHQGSWVAVAFGRDRAGGHSPYGSSRAESGRYVSSDIRQQRDHRRHVERHHNLQRVRAGFGRCRPALNTLGATWTAIVSTATVNAVDNISWQSATDEIYGLDGTLVSDPNGLLFSDSNDGHFDNAIPTDETGAGDSEQHRMDGHVAGASTGVAVSQWARTLPLRVARAATTCM